MKENLDRVTIFIAEALALREDLKYVKQKGLTDYCGGRFLVGHSSGQVVCPGIFHTSLMIAAS
ncbi:hypothetical protein DVH24_009379 [Malus domestica]|uniref:Uncharacterized protein n=1 Tax=Malus domestica TaxID=3750 RepID=A0A498IPY8_MALDO|nr:hypothetical protein DVH24_009379 [Malus domestica]